MTLATLDRSLTSDPCRFSPVEPSRSDRNWRMRHAQSADIAVLKEMFRNLHAFNAALDPRFAPSDEWETYFDAAIEHALQGASLCLIAYQANANLPIGFILGTVHSDSGIESLSKNHSQILTNVGK
jgi:hypothetical protein